MKVFVSKMDKKRVARGTLIGMAGGALVMGSIMVLTYEPDPCDPECEDPLFNTPGDKFFLGAMAGFVPGGVIGAVIASKDRRSRGPVRLAVGLQPVPPRTYGQRAGSLPRYGPGMTLRISLPGR